jgi:hypothetical protein
MFLWDCLLSTFCPKLCIDNLHILCKYLFGFVGFACFCAQSVTQLVAGVKQLVRQDLASFVFCGSCYAVQFFIIIFNISALW